MNPKFQEKLKFLKFLFDRSISLLFCHLLNKLRKFGQTNPKLNPKNTRHMNKYHGSKKIICAPVKSGVMSDDNMIALRTPIFEVITCPIIGPKI